MANEIYSALDTSIRKSNTISKAKLFHGLSLVQMQLFSYAIYVTQQNGESTFNKASFEKQFNMEKYLTERAKSDVNKLIGLSIELPDGDEENFEFRTIFESIKYKNGLFTFSWTEYIKPHILALKSQYIQTDLKIAVKFKSSFSWTLYDYLKASYGKMWLEFSKEELMEIFNVQKTKSYKNNTGAFKQAVLDVAVSEVNQYTEFNVQYEDIKKGRSIVGFTIHFSKGEIEKAATEKQINYLKNLLKSAQFDFTLKIIDVNDSEQRRFAKYLLEELMNRYQYIENEERLTQTYVDENIKKTNEQISLLNKIIVDDLQADKKQEAFEKFDIPIDYWEKRNNRENE